MDIFGGGGVVGGGLRWGIDLYNYEKGNKMCRYFRWPYFCESTSASTVGIVGARDGSVRDRDSSVGARDGSVSARDGSISAVSVLVTPVTVSVLLIHDKTCCLKWAGPVHSKSRACAVARHNLHTRPAQCMQCSVAASPNACTTVLLYTIINFTLKR